MDGDRGVDAARVARRSGNGRQRRVARYGEIRVARIDRRLKRGDLWTHREGTRYRSVDRVRLRPRRRRAHRDRAQGARGHAGCGRKRADGVRALRRRLREIRTRLLDGDVRAHDVEPR